MIAAKITHRRIRCAIPYFLRKINRPKPGSETMDAKPRKTTTTPERADGVAIKSITAEISAPIVIIENKTFTISAGSLTTNLNVCFAAAAACVPSSFATLAACAPTSLAILAASWPCLLHVVPSLNSTVRTSTENACALLSVIRTGTLSPKKSPGAATKPVYSNSFTPLIISPPLSCTEILTVIFFMLLGEIFLYLICANAAPLWLSNSKTPAATSTGVCKSSLTACGGKVKSFVYLSLM